MCYLHTVQYRVPGKRTIHRKIITKEIINDFFKKRFLIRFLAYRNLRYLHILFDVFLVILYEFSVILSLFSELWEFSRLQGGLGSNYLGYLLGVYFAKM